MEYRVNRRTGDRISVIGLGTSYIADSCIHCGHCESRCPFHVKQIARMEEIESFFHHADGR